MNISFFLLPKSEVVYIEKEDTVSRALRVIHKNGFQAVPVIDAEARLRKISNTTSAVLVL